MSESSVIGFGQRFTHSIASAMDFDLPQPEPRDQLVGLGERPVGHDAALAREPHPRPLGARLEPLRREQDPGLRQLLVVLAHGGQELRARELPGLRRPWWP